MLKWKLPISVAVLLAVTSLSVPAQVRQTAPLPQVGPKQTPLKDVVRQPVPLAGRPVGSIRVSPLQKFSALFGKPDAAKRAEGVVFYLSNEQGQLTEEVIGYRQSVRGRYVYDRHGRFDRIEYTDGVTITARYGPNGELAALHSDAGRGIGFSYTAANDGSIRAVSPIENSYEFHTAVALLRLKEIPPWWAEAIQHYATHVDQDEDPGQPTAPEYPGEAFPHVPNAPGPDGEPVPTIPVNAPRMDPEPPTMPDGVDLIPIGGAGAGPAGGGGRNGGGRSGGGGGGTVGDIKDGLDLARREVMIAQCLRTCDGAARTNSDLCAEGPTFRDMLRCNAKVLDFENKCKINCNLGDFTWEWLKREHYDFFAWKGRTPP